MNEMINEYTINEIIDKLKNLDELTILELLDVTSEELCEFLTDQIIERYDILMEYFSESEDDD